MGTLEAKLKLSVHVIFWSRTYNAMILLSY
jgi:hypothetical protein